MAGFLLVAEARMHFRSYKSAEFYFDAVKTRLLINKRVRHREQEGLLRRFFAAPLAMPPNNRLQHFHFWCLQSNDSHGGFSSRTGVPGKRACWGGRKAALQASTLAVQSRSENALVYVYRPKSHKTVIVRIPIIRGARAMTSIMPLFSIFLNENMALPLARVAGCASFDRQRRTGITAARWSRLLRRAWGNAFRTRQWTDR